MTAGYIVFAGSAELLFQLSGQNPHGASSTGFKIASVMWGIVFALIAGWLTARIAVRRPLTHANVLAALIGLGAGISLMLRAGDPAIWSQLAALFLMVPAVCAGGAFAKRTPLD